MAKGWHKACRAAFTDLLRIPSRKSPGSTPLPTPPLLVARRDPFEPSAAANACPAEIISLILEYALAATTTPQERTSLLLSTSLVSSVWHAEAGRILYHHVTLETERQATVWLAYRRRWGPVVLTLLGPGSDPLNETGLSNHLATQVLVLRGHSVRKLDLHGFTGLSEDLFFLPSLKGLYSLSFRSQLRWKPDPARLSAFNLTHLTLSGATFPIANFRSWFEAFATTITTLRIIGALPRDLLPQLARCIHLEHLILDHIAGSMPSIFAVLPPLRSFTLCIPPEQPTEAIATTLRTSLSLSLKGKRGFPDRLVVRGRRAWGVEDGTHRAGMPRRLRVRQLAAEKSLVEACRSSGVEFAVMPLAITAA